MKGHHCTHLYGWLILERLHLFELLLFWMFSIICRTVPRTMDFAHLRVSRTQPITLEDGSIQRWKAKLKWTIPNAKWMIIHTVNVYSATFPFVPTMIRIMRSSNTYGRSEDMQYKLKIEESIQKYFLMCLMCIFVTLRNISTDFYPNIISFTNTKDICFLVRTPMHFSTSSMKR